MVAAYFSALSPQLSASPLGTAFTYQGRLNDGSNLAQGNYDLRFTIYDALVGGTAVAGPLTNAAVSVSSGLFTVALDFGNVFDSSERWLEIAVRPNGGSEFTALSPRQEFKPTPYALYAPTAGSALGVAANGVTGTSLQDGSVTGGKIASGQVVKSLNGLADTVTLTAGSNVNLLTLTSGIQISAVPGGPLSTNVALLNTNQLFGGSNVFAGVMTATNAANVLAGNGSGLVGLNASSLAAGTLPLAQLPASVVTNNATGVTLSGTFSGTLSGLSNLNATVSSNVPGLMTSNLYSQSLLNVRMRKQAVSPVPMGMRIQQWDDHYNQHPEWDTNYCGTCNSTEEEVLGRAAYLFTNGLTAVGYNLVQVECGAFATNRDANGNLQLKPTKYPHGMASLVASLASSNCVVGFWQSITPASGEVGECGDARITPLTAYQDGVLSVVQRGASPWGVGHLVRSCPCPSGRCSLCFQYA